jgi:hypothetical protein
MFKVFAISIMAAQLLLVLASSASAGVFCTRNGSCFAVERLSSGNGPGNGNGPVNRNGPRNGNGPRNSVSAVEPATTLAVGLGRAGAALLRRRK